MSSNNTNNNDDNISFNDDNNNNDDMSFTNDNNNDNVSLSNNNVENTRHSCKHPTASFFHIAFKVAAILCYLLLPWILDSILVFIFCVLLLAFDFWTVKNITGRLLVGLRWWNEVTEEGENIWHFESKQDQKTVNIIDSQLFWIPLISQPIVWILLSITAFLNWHFDWLIVVAVAIILSSTNLWGYVKCKSNARKKVAQFIAQQYLNSMTEE
eukprot:gb/GECH01012496.1/.p1 GENE.gb/GECH01012496.1/~~gb/GECH01012496.1/.p1  ORF type:complete len:212 (+),score=34.90 gb/GECH01012496.1/:1-636(+)